MGELIDRKALLDHLDLCLSESDGKTPITDAVIVAIKCAVEQMPTVDAVEVVRCEDCIHHTDEEPGMVYCPAVMGGWVGNEFYCAGGEKRKENT